MGNQLDEVKKEVKEVKQGIIDVRREVKEEFDGFRKETESKFEGINADMKTQREEWRKPKHAELYWRNGSWKLRVRCELLRHGPKGLQD